MTRLAALRRTPFAFLFAGSRVEDRVTTYVLREHHRGRTLDDVLADPYVRNRLSERQVSRLLERPELVRALGHDPTDEPIGELVLVYAGQRDRRTGLVRARRQRRRRQPSRRS